MDNLLNGNGNLSSLSYASYDNEKDVNDPLFFDKIRQPQQSSLIYNNNHQHNHQIIPQPKRSIPQGTMDSFLNGNRSNKNSNSALSPPLPPPPNLYQDPLSSLHFPYSQQQPLSPLIHSSLLPLGIGSDTTLAFDSNSHFITGSNNINNNKNNRLDCVPAPPGMSGVGSGNGNGNNNKQQMLTDDRLYNSNINNGGGGGGDSATSAMMIRPHSSSSSSSSYYIEDGDDVDVTPFLQQQQQSSSTAAAALYLNNNSNNTGYNSGNSNIINGNARAQSAPLYNNSINWDTPLTSNNNNNTIGGTNNKINMGINNNNYLNDSAIMNYNNNNNNNVRSSSAASQPYNNNNSNNNNQFQQQQQQYNNKMNNNNNNYQPQIPPHHRNSRENNNNNNNGGYNNNNRNYGNNNNNNNSNQYYNNNDDNNNNNTGQYNNSNNNNYGNCSRGGSGGAGGGNNNSRGMSPHIITSGSGGGYNQQQQQQNDYNNNSRPQSRQQNNNNNNNYNNSFNSNNTTSHRSTPSLTHLHSSQTPPINNNAYTSQNLKQQHPNISPQLPLNNNNNTNLNKNNNNNNNTNNNANNSSNTHLFNQPNESAVADLVSETCREILTEAANRSLKAVELANTLRARVGTEILAFVREKWGGLLALLEKHPSVFLVERVPKNDLVRLIATTDNNNNNGTSLIDSVGNNNSDLSMLVMNNNNNNNCNDNNNSNDYILPLSQQLGFMSTATTASGRELSLNTALNSGSSAAAALLLRGSNNGGKRSGYNDYNNESTLSGSSSLLSQPLPQQKQQQLNSNNGNNNSSTFSGLNSQSDIFLPYQQPQSQQQSQSQLYSKSLFTTSSGRSEEGGSLSASRIQTPSILETTVNQYVNNNSAAVDGDYSNYQQQQQQQRQLQQLQPLPPTSTEEIFDNMIERLNIITPPSSYESLPMLDSYNNNQNQHNYIVPSQLPQLQRPNVTYNVPIPTAAVNANAFSLQSSPSPPLTAVSGSNNHGMMINLNTGGNTSGICGYDYRRTHSADIDRSSHYLHHQQQQQPHSSATPPIHTGNNSSSNQKDNSNNNNNASRCLHIGNVPANLNENQLLSEFERFGEVETLKVVTQRNRRFAFVTYKTLEQSIVAKQRMSKIQSWKSAISFAHKESYATSGYVSSSSTTPSPSMNQMQQLRSPSATPPLSTSVGNYDPHLLHSPSLISGMSGGGNAVAGLRDFYYSAAAATLAAANASGGARTASPPLPSSYTHSQSPSASSTLAALYPTRQISPPLPPSYAMPIPTTAASHSAATSTFLNSGGGLVSVHPRRVSPALPSYLLQPQPSSSPNQLQQSLPVNSYRQTSPFLQQQDVIEPMEYYEQPPSILSQAPLSQPVHNQQQYQQPLQQQQQYDDYNHHNNNNNDDNEEDDEDQYYLYGGPSQQQQPIARPSSQMSDPGNNNSSSTNSNGIADVQSQQQSQLFPPRSISPRQQQQQQQQQQPQQQLSQKHQINDRSDNTSTNINNIVESTSKVETETHDDAIDVAVISSNTETVLSPPHQQTQSINDEEDYYNNTNHGDDDDTHSHSRTTSTPSTATTTASIYAHSHPSQSSQQSLSVQSMSLPSHSRNTSQVDFLTDVVPELFSEYATNSAHRLLQPTLAEQQQLAETMVTTVAAPSLSSIHSLKVDTGRNHVLNNTATIGSSSNSSFFDGYRGSTGALSPHSPHGESHYFSSFASAVTPAVDTTSNSGAGVLMHGLSVGLGFGSSNDSFNSLNNCTNNATSANQQSQQQQQVYYRGRSGSGGAVGVTSVGSGSNHGVGGISNVFDNAIAAVTAGVTGTSSSSASAIDQHQYMSLMRLRQQQQQSLLSSYPSPRSSPALPHSQSQLQPGQEHRELRENRDLKFIFKCPVLKRLCDDTYVPTQAWPIDHQLDGSYCSAVIHQLRQFGGQTTISKLRGFLRNRLQAPDNIKSVPLKALLGAYPHLFSVTGNHVSLVLSGLTGSSGALSIMDRESNSSGSSHGYNNNRNNNHHQNQQHNNRRDSNNSGSGYSNSNSRGNSSQNLYSLNNHNNNNNNYNNNNKAHMSRHSSRDHFALHFDDSNHGSNNNSSNNSNNNNIINNNMINNNMNGNSNNMTMSMSDYGNGGGGISTHSLALSRSQSGYTNSSDNGSMLGGSHPLSVVPLQQSSSLSLAPLDYNNYDLQTTTSSSSSSLQPPSTFDIYDHFDNSTHSHSNTLNNINNPNNNTVLMMVMMNNSNNNINNNNSSSAMSLSDYKPSFSLGSAGFGSSSNTAAAPNTADNSSGGGNTIFGNITSNNNSVDDQYANTGNSSSTSLFSPFGGL